MLSFNLLSNNTVEGSFWFLYLQTITKFRPKVRLIRQWRSISKSDMTARCIADETCAKYGKCGCIQINFSIWLHSNQFLVILFCKNFARLSTIIGDQNGFSSLTSCTLSRLCDARAQESYARANHFKIILIMYGIISEYY